VPVSNSQPYSSGEIWGSFGLILGIAALPVSIGAGLSALLAVPLSLGGLALSILARRTAPDSANPPASSRLGSIGLVVNLITLALSLCLLGLVLSGGFNS